MEQVRALLYRQRKILGDLRGFGQLKFGQYWNTATRSPQNPNLWASITRTIWYTSESREKTLTYIDTLLDNAFNWWIDVFYYLRKETHAGYRLALEQAVKEVQIQLLRIQESIINLKGVYNSDEDFKASINSKIEELKGRYEAANREYPINTDVVYTPPQPIITTPIAPAVPVPKAKPAPTPVVSPIPVREDNVSQNLEEEAQEEDETY